MSSATLLVGGLTLGLDGAASVEVAMRLPGMAPFAVRGSTAQQIAFSLDATPDTVPMRELHRFAILDGAEPCRFGIDSNGVYHYRFRSGEEVRFDPRTPDSAHITAMDSPAKLHFALWLAYCMTGASHGRLPVHASVVVCDSRAVLCLGESGTGKSTHTRLWLENIADTYLLNDDSPIVAARREGAAEVFGSPWSGKTPCYRAEHHPVAALLRLEQRPENSIRRLRGLEAIAALQPSCPPAMAHDERCLDMVGHFVGAVVGGTPVYRLGCLPNADAALLSHATIYGD